MNNYVKYTGLLFSRGSRAFVFLTHTSLLERVHLESGPKGLVILLSWDDTQRTSYAVQCSEVYFIFNNVFSSAFLTITYILYTI